MPKHFNRGITAVKAIVILVVVAVVAFGAALALNHWWQPKEGDFDTPEAKLPREEPAGEELGDETADASSNLSSEALAEEEVLETEGWKTYLNEEWGFEVKLPPDWSQVAMLNSSSVDWGNYVSFCLGDEGGHLWKIFDIGVYSKSDWEKIQKIQKEKAGKITYLAENNSYIYVSISPDDNIPFAPPNYLNSVDQILSTFKFTHTPNED